MSEEQRARAVDALQAAREGSPEESQAAQVYALCAVAEAVLATNDALMRIGDELDAINRRLAAQQLD